MTLQIAHAQLKMSFAVIIIDKACFSCSCMAFTYTYRQHGTSDDTFLVFVTRY